MIDPTKQVGNNPVGMIYTVSVDPSSRKPVSPGAYGRYTDARGASQLIRQANFTASTSASATVVAAVPGYLIAVVGYIVQSGDTATQVTFKSNNDTTISHILQNGIYGGCTRPIIYGGSYFTTLPGEPLTITLGAGSIQTGTIDYVLIPDYSLVDEDGNPIVDEDGNPISG